MVFNDGYNWLVVTGTLILFFQKYWESSSQMTFIFFRGVAIPPPTGWKWYGWYGMSRMNFGNDQTFMISLLSLAAPIARWSCDVSSKVYHSISLRLSPSSSLQGSIWYVYIHIYKYMYICIIYIYIFITCQVSHLVWTVIRGDVH